MTSYVFDAELVEEKDGHWSAGVPALPGRATWGHTRSEALRNLQDAVEAYLRDVQNEGREIPSDAGPKTTADPLSERRQPFVNLCPSGSFSWSM
jgi:predicted RNase H-like HicB family nuclease